MATIKYTIEVNWTIHGYSDEFEVHDEDLEGLTDEEREDLIGQMVQESVANQVSWGWEEA